jgi:Zn-dependent protease with chaperone function
MARAETAIAALALVLSPLVLPSMALAHFGLPGRRWFEVDRSAVQLVGREPVVAALEGLESARDGRGAAPASAACALYCVRPGVSTDALATQPPTRDRIDRLDGLGVAADGRPSGRQARSEK